MYNCVINEFLQDSLRFSRQQSRGFRDRYPTVANHRKPDSPTAPRPPHHNNGRRGRDRLEGARALRTSGISFGEIGPRTIAAEWL
jgi:hypothetical protein